MVYLIGGVARSGKSIIRKTLLQEHGIAGISTDSIRAMLEHSMSDSSISHANTPEQNAPKMWPFLISLIRHFIESAEDYVIEGDVLLPDFLYRFIDNQHVRSCFIGYADVSVEQKLHDIKRYDSEKEWTAALSAQELTSFVSWAKSESQKYKKQCNRLSIPYFDMPTASPTQLDDIIEYLTKSN